MDIAPKTGFTQKRKDLMTAMLISVIISEEQNKTDEISLII